MNFVKTKNYFEEYRKIGGIEQYLLHFPASSKEPVILFLHGGPGTSEAGLGYLFKKWWGDKFTIVFWDQRGAGKTSAKNKDISKFELSAEVLLEDIQEIISYLKSNYTKKKIVIMGHSWGSILGTLYAKRFPEDVLMYIGVGQVIDIMDNETVGYAKLKKTIEEKGNKKDILRLAKLGKYPNNSDSEKMAYKIESFRKLQYKYDLAVKMDFSIFIKLLKSPVFKFSDLSIFSVKSFKINRPLIDFLMKFSLWDYDTTYEIPIFYIMGTEDFQTSSELAENYFKKINAPIKEFFFIQNAGHNTMVDEPELFDDALSSAKKMISELGYLD